MRKHGEYTVDACGDVVVFRLFDAWNMETAHAYAKAQEHAARAQPTGGWATVTDVRRWGIAGLEMAAPMQQQIELLTAYGRTHSAYVVGGNRMLRDLIEEFIVAPLSGFHADVFDGDAGAATWLAAEGFDVAAYRELSSFD
ncbi:MAG: hypothetical protein AAGE01_02905 [Pseudomonadota bacterium]